jgi:hypothetical protein
MLTRGRGLFRKPTSLAAPRLAAIRAIIELAGDSESRDAATVLLLALGASAHEITAATLGLSGEEPSCGAQLFEKPPARSCGRAIPS